jgi:pyruvate/2-oxoglutarate dehydrogenase complex dihydrolipoamide dehydrogenase (E3) component
LEFVNFASSSEEPFKVVVVGGGVGALEAALALRELGGERVATTLLAPNPEFVYRPMTVREPFGYAAAKRYPLAEIGRDIGVKLRADGLKRLDAGSRIVHTEAGDQLSYDALLVAVGARLYTRFKHALTIDDGRLDELLHGLIQDIEAGDATDFAIKHGSIAAQQADVAAQAIAALAGVAPEPAPFHPVIHGILLTGGKPLSLSADVTGGSSSSEITDTPTWSPGSEIVAKQLAPYLEVRDRLAASTT